MFFGSSEVILDSQLIPVKTPQGHEELRSRMRRLGPRFRTLLLLVDGERTLDQVLDLGSRAGVPSAYFHDLVSMGLVVVPQALALAKGVPSADWRSALSQQAMPPEVPSAGDSGPDSYVSTVSSDSGLDHHEEVPSSPLEEARYLLLHAVGTEARLKGALTMMRLKRARTPVDLLALLSEVEARINRPDRAIASRQLMGRVAQLLSQAEAQRHAAIRVS